MYLYNIMFGLKLVIRFCYKLNKVHMIVAPPMNDKIVTTVSEIQHNSNVKHKYMHSYTFFRKMFTQAKYNLLSRVQ